MRYLHPTLIYPLSEFNWQAFCTLQAPWWSYKCHKYINKTNIMNPIGPRSQKDGVGTGGVSHGANSRLLYKCWLPGHLIFCYDMVGKGLPGGSVIKSLPAYARTQAQSVGQEDPLEEENVTSLHYSCLENPMNRGAWRAMVHGVTKG